MSDTKKLSRAEACESLARKLGFVCVGADGDYWLVPPKGSPWADNDRSWSTKERAWSQDAPDFFTSRDAAAELVASITDFKQRRAFMDALTVTLQLTEVDYGIDYSDEDFFKVILATPEQISLAACASLGIEVE